MRLWEECSPDKFFNYHRNAPCIFLKLNRIYGWIPDYYNDPHDLPEDMPQQLKDHIVSVKPEEVSYRCKFLYSHSTLTTGITKEVLLCEIQTHLSMQICMKISLDAFVGDTGGHQLLHQ